MSEENKPRLPTQYTRPDLRWAEELLGESLGPLPNQPPDCGTVAPDADASIIPRGIYCYESEAPEPTDCPYFSVTELGISKCSYLNVQAYADFSDYQVEKVKQHYGSLDKAHAAGVFSDHDLSDSYKICGQNLQAPGRAQWLASLITEYRAEVESQPYISVSTTDQSGWNHTEMDEWMISTAWTRFELWQYMTGMVEDIPPELIHELTVADKRFRVKTFPAHELMDPDFAEHMPPHANPQRQYWYMYRKNLGDPEPHEALHDPIGFYPPARPKGK